MKNVLATAKTFAELLAPILTKKKPKAHAESQAFLPWLAKHASPELAHWNGFMAASSVRGGYHNPLFGARTVPFSETLSVADDGCRAARIRAPFLGASPILEDAEELWLAAWAPTANGTSQVWASHQDEREIECLDESIADFVVRQYRDDSDFNNPDDDSAVVLPPELAALKSAKKLSTVEALLGPADLQLRTDWIVALFFPEADWYGIGDGLEEMPTFAEYRKDFDLGARGLVHVWPHHQAYWLMHHLAFDNQDALKELLPVITHAYAPTAELANLATAILEGSQATPKWWKTKRVAGLRETAREQRPDAFEREQPKAKQTASMSAQAHIAELKRKAAAACKRDVQAAGALEQFELVMLGSGRVGEFEEEILKAQHAGDPDKFMGIFLHARRGNAPTLQQLLRAIAEPAFLASRKAKNAELAAALIEYARALLELGAALEETHAKAKLGALTLLGASSRTFAEFVGAITKRFGPLDKLGRIRRLEIVVVAEQHAKHNQEAAALNFLRSEAARFAKQIDEWETDTAMLGLGALVRLDDPSAVELLTQMLQSASFSGANWGTLMAFVEYFSEVPKAWAGAALELATTRKFGTDGDGERGLIAEALAKCDPKRAQKRFAAKLVKAKSDVEKATCCSALLIAKPKDAALVAEARGLLQKLDPGNTASAGAAIALLRAAGASASAKQFAPELAHWKQAKNLKTTELLRAWLTQA